MEYSTDYEYLNTMDSVLYTDTEIKEEKPPRLSLSISQPDWSVFMDGGEKSVKFTDDIIGTPEILSQCLEWQFPPGPNNTRDLDTISHSAVTTLMVNSGDQNAQISAIKNELQDYEASVPSVITLDHEAPSRPFDGGVSPAPSEVPSSVNADCSDDDDDYYPSSVSSTSRGRRSGRPAKSGRQAQKRKLSDCDKDSNEYKEKRKRNNIAVRKSRDKAKQHHLVIEDRNSVLEAENKELKKKNESLVKEVSVLRKLITDIGKRVPSDLDVSLIGL